MPRIQLITCECAFCIPACGSSFIIACHATELIVKVCKRWKNILSSSSVIAARLAKGGWVHHEVNKDNLFDSNWDDRHLMDRARFATRFQFGTGISTRTYSGSRISNKHMFRDRFSFCGDIFASLTNFSSLFQTHNLRTGERIHYRTPTRSVKSVLVTADLVACLTISK